MVAKSAHYRLIVTDLAMADIKTDYDYNVKHESLNRPNKVKRRILSALKRIRQNHLLTHSRPIFLMDGTVPVRRVVLEKKPLFLYRLELEADLIVVLRIPHTAAYPSDL